ncbi:MAG: hypothetical protein M0T74_02040 [Desulfitobacterium hafniense]|nr:hypothetical protein [Desulfitobacterium hafniense]
MERSNLSASLVRAAYRVTGVNQNPGDIHSFSSYAGAAERHEGLPYK